MAQTIEHEGKLARIERGLDREVANRLPISRSSGGAFSIAPQSMGELLEFAKLMSLSDFCVRPGFRGNPGACLAVALQAFRTGGDPFAWANKAYITKSSKTGEEQISYEAQLIHALIVSSGVLQRRLRPEYSGDGVKRKCKIIGYIKGEDEPFEYQSPAVDEIKVQNSPLWTADRDQQLFYYSTRAWARRHVPEVLLGIYAPEDVGEVIDMDPEPEPQRGDFQKREPELPPPAEIFSVMALDGEVFEFETADRVIEALRTVLTSARRGGARMLDAAVENNESVIAQLGGAGAELVEEFTPSPPSELRTESPAPVSNPAPDSPGRALPPEPPGRPPERESAPPPSRQAAPVEPTPEPPPAAADDDDDVFPGDLPSGQRLVPRQAGPQSSEERASKFIALPLSRGKPDYRTFVRALLMTKIRQQTDGTALAYLLGDNAEAIEAARGSLPRPDIAELDEAIDAAWARLRP